MEVRFFTRNVELPGDIKDYMEKKLVKIEKFFDRILDTQVVLNYKRGMNVVEITANVNGVIMRGEDYAPDLRKAFDKALKNIERQVKKHKSYLTDRARMKVQDVSFDIDPEIIAASAPEKPPSAPMTSAAERIGAPAAVLSRRNERISAASAFSYGNTTRSKRETRDRTVSKDISAPTVGTTARPHCLAASSQIRRNRSALDGDGLATVCSE